MAKILIDTNFFLNIIRKNNDVKIILDDLKSISKHLIFTDQILDEFNRNIEKEVAVKKKECVCLSVKSYLCEETREIAKKYNEALEKEKVEIDNNKCLLKDFFDKLDNNFLVIKRTPEIVGLAEQRRLIGNPPKSTTKNSVGDEIIWETLLAWGEDDIVIISSDGTFEDNKEFLSNEYKNKTGYQLLAVTKELEKAKSHLKLEKNQKIEKLEQENKKLEISIIERINNMMRSGLLLSTVYPFQKYEELKRQIDLACKVCNLIDIHDFINKISF